MLSLGNTGSPEFSVHMPNGVISEPDMNRLFGYKLDGGSGRNGIFVQWRVKNNCFTFSNDPYGFFPVYYRSGQDAFSFSSSIFDLLEDSGKNDMDDAAIAVFLRTGFYPGDRTPFVNIKALPPGSRVCLDEKGLRVNQEIPVSEAVSHLDIGTAIKRYGEVFRAAIAKFKPVFAQAKVGVPISGGRDSRHILYELVSSGLLPHSGLTVRHQPPKSDEDTEIAGQVCSALRVDHRVLEQPLSFLAAEVEKNRLTNLCSLEHSWILPLARFLSEQKYDVIFDGIGGDVLSAGLFLTENRLKLYRQKKFEVLAEDILGSEGYLPRVLTRPAYRRFSRGGAVCLLMEELARYSDAPNPVGQFFFWNRTRRHVGMSSWRILNRDAHVFAPYLDEDVYRFLSGLPAEVFLDRQFHDQAIDASYPEFAGIPYETKKAAPKPAPCFDRLYQIAQLACQLSRRPETPLLNSGFLISRLLAGAGLGRYYHQTKQMFKVPIYLQALSEYT